MRLERVFAFMESEYSLFRLIERIGVAHDRLGPDGPYYDVWKLSVSYPHRQYFLWRRIEQPGFLQDHARAAWGPFGNERPPLTEEMIAASIADVAASVAKIRARGGEVVFVRPPSAGLFLERENRNAPRANTWDRLLQETGCVRHPLRGLPGDAAARGARVVAPLARDAARFTRAYVDVLQ